MFIYFQILFLYFAGFHWWNFTFLLHVFCLKFKYFKILFLPLLHFTGFHFVIYLLVYMFIYENAIHIVFPGCWGMFSKMFLGRDEFEFISNICCLHWFFWIVYEKIYICWFLCIIVEFISNKIFVWSHVSIVFF